MSKKASVSDDSDSDQSMASSSDGESSEDESSNDNEDVVQHPSDEPVEHQDDGSTHDDMMVEQDAQDPPPIRKPTLTRVWTLQKSHRPIYTGGKIEAAKDFLLLPVYGDLALVVAGSQEASIRGLETQERIDDEEDEDELDQDAIVAFALTPDERTILTCSHNTILRQYSISENEGKEPRWSITEVRSWGRSGHRLPVADIQYHVSSVFLAVASVDGSVRIWDARGPHITHSFKPMADGYEGGGSGTLRVTAVQWMDNVMELKLAIGRDDGSICIHNLREDSDAVILRDHDSAVTSMRWTDNAKYFVSAGRDAVLNLWELGTVQRSKRTVTAYTNVFTLPVYEEIEGMVLCTEDDSLHVYLAGSKGCVRCWKANLLVDRPKLEFLKSQPDTNTDEIRGCTNLSTCVISHSLIVTDTEFNLTYLSMLHLEVERSFIGKNDHILDVKAVPTNTANSPRVVVITNSPQVRMFDTSDLSCEVLHGHSAMVLSVDVSPCGSLISTCGKDKCIRVWCAITKRTVAVAQGHTEAVNSISLSKRRTHYSISGKAADNGGGAFCVSVSMDRTLKRWNLPGLEGMTAAHTIRDLVAYRSIKAHEKDTNIVSVAPSDSYIATGSQDKTAKIWRASDLSLLATLRGHKRGIWDCQFSPIDRVLATSSGDHCIRLWSLSEFTCLRTFQGHQASVLRVRFITGGLQLVSSGADALIKTWTIRSNECECTLDKHDDKVWALDTFGDFMVSAGADSKLLLWSDTTQDAIALEQEAEAEVLAMEQNLQNYMRHKEFDKALNIALTRDKPHHSLRILTSMTQGVEDEEALKALKQAARSWTPSMLLKILEYCREWNTRARNSPIALLTINAIVTTFRMSELIKVHGASEVMDGIVPYAERHFARLDRLYADSFVLDHVLGTMGNLSETECDDEGAYDRWEKSSRPVLPPIRTDGKIQVGGKSIVAPLNKANRDSDSVHTEGESDSDESFGVS